MLGYAFIGVLAFFIHINPFANGMILAFAFNIFTLTAFYLIRINSFNDWIRIIGNLLLNFIFFRYLGEMALKLL
jgi:hypothetical protein